MKQTHRSCTPLAACSTDTILALFVHVALVLRCPGTDQRSEYEQQVDYLHVSWQLAPRLTQLPLYFVQIISFRGSIVPLSSKPEYLLTSRFT